MTRSSGAVLFTTPVLAPISVLDAMNLPSGTRVAASSDLPDGWGCVLLNLWPDVLENGNRSLIATVTKPRPNPHATRSDGELLRNLRRRVHGWLNATDRPADESDAVNDERARSYTRAETFATGKPGTWSDPVHFGERGGLKRRRLLSTETRKRPHKSHAQRRDLYWALTTDKGHRVLYKAASAVGRAMSSGTAPVPPGWHLSRGVGCGDGVKGAPVDKIRRVRADYDADPSVSFTQRLAVDAFVIWIKNAVRNPTDGGLTSDR